MGLVAVAIGFLEAVRARDASAHLRLRTKSCGASFRALGVGLREGVLVATVGVDLFDVMHEFLGSDSSRRNKLFSRIGDILDVVLLVVEDDLVLVVLGLSGSDYVFKIIS